ncbi:MAG: hypothetical protein AAGG51_09105 [Cyanobacteria bacterium P01_G01_bin.54]
MKRAKLNPAVWGSLLAMGIAYLSLDSLPVTAQISPSSPQDSPLSEATLYPEDFPGFESESPENLAEIRREIESETGEGVRLQSFFLLYKSTFPDFQVVGGATYCINDVVDHDGVDTEGQRDPAELQRLLGGLFTEVNDVLGGADIGDRPDTTLPDLPQIGDVTVGTRRTIAVLGFPVDMDTIFFQRSSMMGVTITGYLKGNPPTILPITTAQLLDERIQTVLAGETTPCTDD